LLTGTIAGFPNVIAISIGTHQNTAKTTMLVRTDGGLNCEKLADTDLLADKITSEDFEFSQAQKDLECIIAAPSRYKDTFNVICSAVASGFIAPQFFAGGWIELVLCFALGAFVGLLGLLADKYVHFGRVYTPVTAVLVGFIVRCFNGWVTEICYGCVTLSSLIWLLPGLSITLSMMELGTRNIISGTSRMFAALLVALQLGFGIAIGSRLAFFVKLPMSGDCPHGLRWEWQFLNFPLTNMAFILLLKAHPRQVVAMFTTSTAGYVVQLLTMNVFKILTLDVATATAAFVVGIIANLFCKFFRFPVIVPILAGVMMLVPGSVSVRGVEAMMAGDYVSGINFAWEVLIVALSITVGTMISTLAIFPRKVILAKFY